MKKILNNPIRIKGKIISSAWGMPAGSLVSKAGNDFNSDKLYAEYWLGANEKAPASIVDSNYEAADLQSLIRKYPAESLGNIKTTNHELPFLFKILSIGQNLSIQAHPDKEQAKKLHLKDPKNYPDDNHKPEMGIALTEVDLLYGFRPWKEIEDNILNCPEFKDFIDNSCGLSKLHDDDRSDSEKTKVLYLNIFDIEHKKVAVEHLTKLINRIQKETNISEAEQWILKLKHHHEPYPDPSLFSFFLLNIVKLKAGDAIFIAPHILHSYLNGEIIECMANSDNVVRGGLTEKFTDIEALEAIIDYSAAKVENLQIKIEKTRCVVEEEYLINVQEFSVKKLSIAENCNTQIVSNNTPRIIFCFLGEAVMKCCDDENKMKEYDSFFIPAAANDFDITTINKTVLYIIGVGIDER